MIPKYNGPGVYQIKNTLSGRSYIGSSVSVRNRCLAHLRQLRSNGHPNAYLQSSWKKHGESGFVFSVVEECDKPLLIEREQFWIDTLNTYKAGFNQRPKAESCLGIVFSADRKARISARMRDPATVKKCAKAKLGNVLSADHKAKISASSKGRKLSEATKKKMSSAAKLREFTPEQLARLGKAALGYKHTDAARSLISSALAKRPPISEATRTKLREAAKRRDPAKIAAQTARLIKARQASAVR